MTTSLEGRTGWHRLSRAGLLCALACVSSAPPALAQDEFEGVPLNERVIEHTLDNGWRFLLMPHGGAPTVSFETYVATGSVDDPPGKEGLTHHVKNLLFKGSPRLGTRDWEKERFALEEVDDAYEAWRLATEAGDMQEVSSASVRLASARQRASEWVISEQYSRVLEDAGGGASLNAFTDEDSTRFVVTLPSNQLEVWCWMESERFRSPVFREFFVERDALLEDRRGRVETDPMGLLGLELRATAYGTHPLGRPTLGTAESIAQLDRPSAQDYFRRRFGARNLITAVVGNFDPARFVPMLDAYFSSIPAGPETLEEPPPIPEQTGERRVNVLFDGRPVVALAWHVPPRAHRDSAAVELAIRLLGYARSSRLEKALVRERALVSQLISSPAWGGDQRGGLAMIRAIPNLEVEVERVEAAIHAEIERLAEQGPEVEELAGAKRVATADHIRSLRDHASIAAGLCASLAKSGDWRHFFSTGRRLSTVSAEDVQRVLQTWFVPENRTVAHLISPEEPK